MGNNYLQNKCNSTQKCQMIIMMETLVDNQFLQIEVEDFYLELDGSQFKIKISGICSKSVSNFSSVSDLNVNYFFANNNNNDAYDICNIPGFYNQSQCPKANIFGYYNYNSVNSTQSMAFYNILNDNTFTDLGQLYIGIRQYNSRNLCQAVKPQNCKIIYNQTDCQICNEGYYNNYDNICKPCSNYNQYCTQCNQNQFLECLNQRIAPNCYCYQNYVPDTNSNCNECPNGTYFSQSIYENFKLNNGILINDYSNQVCQSCTDINQFCTECDENGRCYKCEGYRIAPDCYCSLGLVPNTSNYTNCISCANEYYFDVNTYNTKIQNQSFISFESYSSEVCLQCRQLHNQFCNKCDINQCLQCDQDRIAPHCVCEKDLMNNSTLTLANYNSQVCISCSSTYNQFCIQCDENKCLQCDGDRIPPYCYCQHQLVPNQSNSLVCEQCQSGGFYNQTLFQQIYTNKSNLDQYSQIVCIFTCQNFNQYCLECDDKLCHKCAGNRVLPDCLCSPGYVAKSTDMTECKLCADHQYYSEQKYNQYNCNQNYTCSEQELCIDCATEYNQLCAKCNKFVCTECLGQNRDIPDSNCTTNYVPSISNTQNCELCPGNNYYNQTAIEACSQTDKLNQVTGCQQTDFCIFYGNLSYCDDLDVFYNNISDEYECTSCQGNRIVPYCQCKYSQLPISGNETYCQSCQLGYYYDPNLDSCYNVIDYYLNYDCTYEQACIACTETYNQFCVQCNTEKCLACEGNRLPPYCKCPDLMVTNQDDLSVCKYCYYNTYYNAPADLCNNQSNDGKYDCFYKDLCIDCTVYNKFCILCNQNEYLECLGNRMAPYCKCPSEWVTPNKEENSNSITCVQCNENEYYDERQDICRISYPFNQYDQNQVDQYVSNLECYKNNICNECEIIHKYCQNCIKDQLNLELKCLSCFGDYIVYEYGYQIFFGEQLNVFKCKCPNGFYSFDDSNYECTKCVDNAECDGTDFRGFRVQKQSRCMFRRYIELYLCTR
ncbi:hypothetical protein PPERSA_01922 [Pseudocohnilembus persalinus]|uniref:Insulin-like growth factor binding protein, N-terminal n=1 Tax=Pseudocohnilembus persalinus TaxID=266149 RepID=A0A0V0R3H5_PSEPJ|nr:hypothetical protein PPERSA_01922 [Pseudocohnilembus persalinus]|eukprot:KRX09035.1 hypothetical protein PPERSA_01922 [Pseudocohnilembus persalinus]